MRIEIGVGMEIGLSTLLQSRHVTPRVPLHVLYSNFSSNTKFGCNLLDV